jgi:hypothetical protein
MLGYNNRKKLPLAIKYKSNSLFLIFFLDRKGKSLDLHPAINGAVAQLLRKIANLRFAHISRVLETKAKSKILIVSGVEQRTEIMVR